MLKLAPEQPDTVTESHHRELRRRRAAFRVSLDGVTLWDLIQMACLSGLQRAVRVRSDNREGFLFFNDGLLVHAVAGHSQGDEAVMAMLEWDGGVVAPCQIEWPTVTPVDTPWQTLLLHAAHRQDEQTVDDGIARQSQVHVLDAELEPEPEPAPEPEPERVAARTIIPPEPPAKEVEREDEEPEIDYEDSDPYVWSLSLDSEGAVLHQNGGARELPGCVAHAMRLGNLVGELLALGEITAMEISHGAASVISYRDVEGGVVAVEPATEEERVALRKRLEL